MLFGNFWWAALLLRLPSVPPFPTSHFSFPPWTVHFLYGLPHGSENIPLLTSHVSFPAFHFPLFTLLCSRSTLHFDGRHLRTWEFQFVGFYKDFGLFSFGPLI